MASSLPRDGSQTGSGWVEGTMPFLFVLDETVDLDLAIPQKKMMHS